MTNSSSIKFADVFRTFLIFCTICIYALHIQYIYINALMQLPFKPHLKSAVGQPHEFLIRSWVEYSVFEPIHELRQPLIKNSYKFLPARETLDVVRGDRFNR